ncbi:MAG: hypothetical protein KA072_10595 [Thermoanaerobaculaceae bacterium]|nr:hypothetical protein [Thermoanaerobaculaceae bacterium]MDI9621676.1 hypothetical protein [Acidobacteriota bacterium]NLH11583.1 hypothetical protein [Holophagae bacterium]HPW55604.1 hypothetical protein [Thermoanaerobaculaceae bacterium]
MRKCLLLATLILAAWMFATSAGAQTGGDMMIAKRSHVEYIPAGQPGGPLYYCMAPGFLCVLSWNDNGDNVGYDYDIGQAFNEFFIDFMGEAFCELLPWPFDIICELI